MCYNKLCERPSAPQGLRPEPFGAETGFFPPGLNQPLE